VGALREGCALRRARNSQIWSADRSRPSRHHNRRAIGETRLMLRFPGRAAEGFRISNHNEAPACAPRLERHRCARGGTFRTVVRRRVSRRGPALRGRPQEQCRLRSPDWRLARHAEASHVLRRRVAQGVPSSMTPGVCDRTAPTKKRSRPSQGARRRVHPILRKTRRAHRRIGLAGCKLQPRERGALFEADATRDYSFLSRSFSLRSACRRGLIAHVFCLISTRTSRSVEMAKERPDLKPLIVPSAT